MEPVQRQTSPNDPCADPATKNPTELLSIKSDQSSKARAVDFAIPIRHFDPDAVIAERAALARYSR